jgi:hypothetical protein
VKTIRIWNGCKVVQVIGVHEDSGSSSLGAVGGAHNSTRIDIEIDPWAGLLVDHSMPGPPVMWRQEDGL